jgi:hypothetical protein
VRNLVYTAIAIAVGLVILLGYFIQLDLLVNLRVVLLGWATQLAAIALLVGVVNLVSVHWRKSTSDHPNRVNSIVLIVAFVITLFVAGILGPTSPYSLWIFNYIQIPIEGSLMAILTVVLIYAGVRLLRRKPNLLSIVFIATAVVILLMTGPLFGIDIPGLAELRIWIGKVPAVAGARGILLGVSLGVVAAGLRILIGADRPYGGN